MCLFCLIYSSKLGMVELVVGIEKEEEKNIEYYLEFLHLGDAVDEEYIERYRKSNWRNGMFNGEEKEKYNGNLMDDYEANYALKLLSLGLCLFREPKFKEGCNSRADFFVYSEELKDGVLVEITSLPRKHNSESKSKQHDNLSKSSDTKVPFIPLFKEDLEDMGVFFTLEAIDSQE